MIIDGKRKQDFCVWKRRGKPASDLDAYYLVILVQEGRHRGWWHVPVGYHGDLAATPPPMAECYEVSWRRVPGVLKPSIRACVKRIEDHGTPIERDEHIYGGNS